MDLEQFKKLLERYEEVKKLYIVTEETDPDLNTNLQPLNEFRATLDHVFRAIKLLLENNAEGADVDLDKANSHLCRAFYDICDATSINYREKIQKILSVYAPDEIRDVIPNYYSEYRIQLDKINDEIGELRTEKGKEEALSAQTEYVKFDRYIDLLKQLREIYDVINSSVSSLEEVREKNIRRDRKAHVGTFVVGALSTIAATFLINFIVDLIAK